MTDDALLTVEDVARHFRMSRNTVTAKIRSGEWPCLDRKAGEDAARPGGRRYLFRPADIAAIEALMLPPRKVAARKVPATRARRRA